MPATTAIVLSPVLLSFPWAVVAVTGFFVSAGFLVPSGFLASSGLLAPSFVPGFSGSTAPPPRVDQTVIEESIRVCLEQRRELAQRRAADAIGCLQLRFGTLDLDERRAGIERYVVDADLAVVLGSLLFIDRLRIGRDVDGEGGNLALFELFSLADLPIVFTTPFAQPGVIEFLGLFCTLVLVIQAAEGLERYLLA